MFMKQKIGLYVNTESPKLNPETLEQSRNGEGESSKFSKLRMFIQIWISSGWRQNRTEYIKKSVFEGNDSDSSQKID